IMSEGVRLYAGTQHGLIVWRSTASGWQEVARHFEDGIIDSIHGCKQSPETVYVGVTHDGLYRTLDAGKSWSRCSAAKTAATAGRKSASFNRRPRPCARTGGIPKRRTTAMCATFISTPMIRRQSICVSSTAALCAASIAAKPGKT